VTVGALDELRERPGALAELTTARDLLAGTPGRWRVLYHNDGDGVASATVAALALLRWGRSWQLTPLVSLEEARLDALLAKTRSPVLVLDTGASYLTRLARHSRPVIVLDHHRPPAPEEPSGGSFLHVNPHHWGVDGMSECSASMLTYLFARCLDTVNEDLVAYGFAGAVADRMHVGGFQGLNLEVLERAVSKGLLSRRRELSLVGPALGEGLSRSVDPYVVGLSGHPDQVPGFLNRLGVDPRTPIPSLSEEDRRTVASALALRLLAQGARPEFCERVSEEHLYPPPGGDEVTLLSTWQNACAREGEPSRGIALALGDPGDRDRAQALERHWQDRVLKELGQLETGRKVEVHDFLQAVWVPDANLAGPVAGLALAYLLDPTRPVFALSAEPARTKVSARGTPFLTDRGLDLSVVVREAARSVGGEGGGHRVASGASVPKGQEGAFLQEADRRLSLQGFRPAPREQRRTGTVP
jgi:single-stranded-DNA-specific exonuclease